MRPQFYCLKYRGLLSPVQIVQDCIRIGWKCRKYQRWKQVHTCDGDGDFLKATGDALVGEGELDLSTYGRLSEILLNVQKWRFDKDSLLRDPPITAEWDSIDQLILLGDQSTVLLKRRLTELGLFSENLRSDVCHAFVVFFDISRLAAEVGLSTTNEERTKNDHISDVNLDNENDVLQFAREQTDLLYASVGLQSPAPNDVFTLLSEVGRDLGLSPYAKIDAKLMHDVESNDVSQSVVLRLGRIDRLKLFQVNSVKGMIIVTVNENHPFVLESFEDPAVTKWLGRLAIAYGAAANDMFGSSEQVNEFTSYLGLALARSVGELAVAQFEKQVSERVRVSG